MLLTLNLFDNQVSFHECSNFTSEMHQRHGATRYVAVYTPTRGIA